MNKERKKRKFWLKDDYVIMMGNEKTFHAEMIKLIVSVIVGIALTTIYIVMFPLSGEIWNRSPSDGIIAFAPFGGAILAVCSLISVIQALTARRHYMKNLDYYKALDEKKNQSKHFGD